MEEKSNFITNDKRYSPFLFACSMNGYLVYIREFTQHKTIYFEFSPREKAKQLIDQFEVKNPLCIPERDLFDAIEYFWKKVYDAKGNRQRYRL
ncbi:TPA: hypothetical protein DEP93_00040 [candidate division WWE3 bacterium]|uniref:DUF5659 domain-containing protein n=1 Tax=candidate division WWE3 bacterium TaxID=2053526 RepID=A0A3D0ZNK3_UNCKA|nr:MAG: hypothetical protein A2245_02035 [candidate division WWE3 bacterium RIFOXYA2_FULL_43_12]HCC41851.1 hypothetical protein [candidate division WWE3 bacterium]